VGHITLGIADIELIEVDEVELDEEDLVVVGQAPSFDDMPTVVRAIGRVAHGRR